MATVEALQIDHVTDNSGHKVAGVDATVHSIDMKPDESVCRSSTTPSPIGQRQVDSWQAYILAYINLWVFITAQNLLEL